MNRITRTVHPVKGLFTVATMLIVPAAVAVPLLTNAAGASTASGPIITSMAGYDHAAHVAHVDHENVLARESTPVWIGSAVASQPAYSPPSDGYVVTSPAAVRSALHFHHEVYRARLARGMS